MVLSVLLVGLGLVLLTVDGPHEKFHSAVYSLKSRWRLFFGALELLLGSSLLISSRELVPNPLFDLAGIMCGQFGIPFWKFFFATLTGKALIKTHIQLLALVENELIWILGHIPGFSSVSTDLSSTLHMVKEKYLSPRDPGTANTKTMFNLEHGEEEIFFNAHLF
ncbi:hypothetical protein Taro_020712 [Colocasia esculenta]|uniref:Uncharacterized protein n=1 Tax=Colocasia esculenta TaxID=4460 RepID=A0A843UZG8_COLES|nr:hypothetical protein [Colocasia esculenta]